ncbi:hypothetical protein JDW21_19080 [Bacillus subtilis]|uniref:Uncharacterized protein n=3 Tax=root TaxID=1 RepID=A0AAE9G6E7_9CAUD|nr:MULTISPECIES: hypothetical protein [Bacillus subtilis group]YP_010681787.1 hypothetical protein PQE76_gp169 [Bacillus phage vB_BsuS_PJN02]YP_010740067.1 hypothetical protein P9294_gp050 [Bacillus phage FADO]UUG68136.1 hypothetical protein [Bacillus phage PK-3]MCR4362092.1 hypothetical protein [Bacillus subtilis]UNH58512.1 hypothetical protein [Bacillus phage vB_BsuS_PJN02]UNY48765.1 hypothetical protein fado_50 [Bacillus phage FADO]UQB84296.1 hypothetical protein KMZ31_19430 [Bacillus amy
MPTTRAKNKKRYTIHKTEIHCDKDRVKAILDARDIDYKELHYRVTEKFGLDIKYNSFMDLIKNINSWKLIYAWALADVLHKSIEDLFIVVDVDVEKKIKEKEKWNEQYGKKG